MVNTNSLYTCSLFYVKKAWLKKKKEISLASSSQTLMVKAETDKSWKLIKLLVKKVCLQIATVSLL